MSPLDKKKLLKPLTAGRGSILAPHIEAYQRRAKFPKTWQIEIRNEKPHDGYFHPSSDAFSHPKDLYRDMKGLTLPGVIPPALRRTFDCGHMWHGYLQAMLIEMGFVKPQNVERYISKVIYTAWGPVVGAGTGDLIDVQIPGRGSWLVDIKTMGKNEFESGANPWTMKKWQAQVSCYMDWFDASKAMILCICKDSPHAFREYQIIKDQPLLNQIYDRWGYTAWCLREGKEPSEDYFYEVEDAALLNPGDSVLDVEMAK
jgi:hypothetical protein